MKRRATTPDDFDFKRQHILRVAAAEFMRVGYDQANVNTIADLAGIGKGTLYRYAASKEQLYHDVLEWVANVSDNRILESMEAGIGLRGRDRIRHIVDTIAYTGVMNADFAQLQNNALSTLGIDPWVRSPTLQSMQEWVASYTDILQAEQDALETREVDARIVGVMLFCMLHAYVQLPALLGYEDWPSPEWCEAITDLLWKGLAPDSGRKKHQPDYYHGVTRKLQLDSDI